MTVPVYIFLPVLGGIIGAIIGAREYRNYNRRKKKNFNR